MRRRFALLAALTLVAGCDDVTSSPTAPDTPGSVSLVGAYQSSEFWTARVISLGITLYTRSCPGRIVVEAQDGASWSGTFASEAPCPVESGGVRGTVDGAGRVTMRFDGVTIADTPYGAGPCPEIELDLSGAPVLEGRLDQGVLELEIETTAKCLEPEVSAKLELSAKGARQT